MSETDRVLLVDNLIVVDFVVVFNEDTPQDLINSVDPDVIVKGGDYKVEDVVGHDIAKVIIVPLVDGISTTKIIERMKNG